MKRAIWAITVGGVMLTAAAGCSLTEVKLWLNPEAEAVGEYYLAQSVAEAALMTEITLNRLGLQATSTPQANGVILDSATKKGSKFRVILTSDAERRTRLQVQWIDQIDRDVQVLVIDSMQAVLTPPAAKK